MSVCLVDIDPNKDNFRQSYPLYLIINETISKFVRSNSTT